MGKINSFYKGQNIVIKPLPNTEIETLITLTNEGWLWYFY